VNDDRSDRAIQDDQLEQVGGPVGSEHQIACRIFAHVLDHDRVLKCSWMSSVSTPWRSAEPKTSTTEL
jgi:hypothetical protein